MIALSKLVPYKRQQGGTDLIVVMASAVGGRQSVEEQTNHDENNKNKEATLLERIINILTRSAHRMGPRNGVTEPMKHGG